VKKGQLVAIVGSVGSGKSSLLSTLLGEMVLIEGQVHIRAQSTIAYCDQRPWIVNATVEENITFGKTFDQKRMDDAIFACCMQDDLTQLSLKTEIGERGINLSGGQKARVALARAVYNDADIYLLDDPISAVDAHVGMHIVEHCIKGALSGKTRFLVTHHLNILPSCDIIVILDVNGTMKMSGSYDELIHSGVDLSQYLGHKEEESTTATAAAEATASASASEPAVVVSATDNVTGTGTGTGAGTSTKAKEEASSKKQASESKKESKTNVDNNALTTAEERKEGHVTFDTYWSYISFGGLAAFFVTIFFQLGSQVLGIEANFWLADWGKETTILNLFFRKNMSMDRS
jgi:ATP-binding cassette subfamily C (CFTR/MRP) protein 1